MPKILLLNGYSFYFFANEGAEPPHIHVVKAAATAKFWIDRDVTLEYSYGFRPAELHFIFDVLESRQAQFLSDWHDFFRQSSS